MYYKLTKIHVKTTKIVLGVVVIVVIVLLATMSGKQGNTGPIKIGVILPLTGPAQSAGEASKKTVEMAMSNLPDEIKSRVSIVFEDDQLDAKLSVLAAQKLISIDKVSALITYGSGSSVAVSNIAETNQIPMIGLGNSPDINLNKKWVVRYVPSSELLINALENLILKDKYKKVAIIWNQSDGPKANADQTIKVLPAAGYTIVANESVAKGENDFKTSITKIRSSNPDVVISYLSPQVGIFAKQIRDLGWNVPMVGIINFESAGQIKIANGALDNQLFVGDRNADFINQFYLKYAMYPATAGDNLYDAINQLAKALTKDKANVESVSEYLRVDFVGVSGEYKHLGDGSFDLQQVVKTWEGSKFVEVK